MQDLTNPPVAFNIAAVILLIGAVGMVTDSSASSSSSSAQKAPTTPAVVRYARVLAGLYCQRSRSLLTRTHTIP